MSTLYLILSIIAALSIEPIAQPSSLETFGKIYWQEQFTNASSDRFFDKIWHNYKKASSEEIGKIYRFRKELNNVFLLADHDYTQTRNSIHLGKFFTDNGKRSLRKYPFLHWKWRVIHYPTVKPGQSPIVDTPATVYVVFQRSLLSLNGIKFSWSPVPDAQKGFYKKERTGMLYFILHNGNEPTNAWIEEKVDLCAIYKKQYAEKQCNTSLEYIGVLTDADYTKSRSIGNFDDFTWSER